MAQMVEKTKQKKLGTLETQELIYKKYLQDFRTRHGMSFEELIGMANDPRKRARRPKVKKREKKP